MKKTILILSLLCLLLSNQNTKAQAFSGEGDLQLNLGVSLGLIGYNYNWNYYGWPNNQYRRTNFIPLTLNVEYGIHKYIGVGVYAGYFHRGYRHRTLTDDWTMSRYYSFGGRATFHGTAIINEALDLNINENAWDFYATVFAGMEIRNHSERDIFGIRYVHSYPVRIIGGIILGARYMFNNRFGLYLEGGRGTFGLATFGATFKLK